MAMALALARAFRKRFFLPFGATKPHPAWLRVGLSSRGASTILSTLLANALQLSVRGRIRLFPHIFWLPDLGVSFVP
jgi:hypothetical protein